MSLDNNNRMIDITSNNGLPNDPTKSPISEPMITKFEYYEGFGMEDSMIWNESGIQRGRFRAQALKKYNRKINIDA